MRNGDAPYLRLTPVQMTGHQFFELGRLSSGAAARLAGVPRVVFLSRLVDYGVDTFDLTEEQIEKETRLA